MKSLMCELCGSNDIIKTEGLYVCQHCGTKYTVEEARKMMVEGTVSIDRSSELDNLFELARRARKEKNTVNAQKYYEEILTINPSSWEAAFFSTYYQSLNIKVAEISLGANRITNCTRTALELIRDNIDSSDEQRKAILDISTYLMNASLELFRVSEKTYYDLSYGYRIRYVKDYINRGIASRDILLNAGNWILELFGESYGITVAAMWKIAVIEYNSLNSVLPERHKHAQSIDILNMRIKQYDPSYIPPMTNVISRP